MHDAAAPSRPVQQTPTRPQLAGVRPNRGGQTYFRGGGQTYFQVPANLKLGLTMRHEARERRIISKCETFR